MYEKNSIGKHPLSFWKFSTIACLLCDETKLVNSRNAPTTMRQLTAASWTRREQNLVYPKFVPT